MGFPAAGRFRRGSGELEYIKVLLGPSVFLLHCSDKKSLSYSPLGQQQPHFFDIHSHLCILYSVVDKMKLSAYLGFVALLAAGFAAAAPAPGGEGSKPKKPPGPPPGKFSSAQQQCSASQSSISCCNTSSTKNHGSHTVNTNDGAYSMDCNQIIGESPLQLLREPTT